MQHVMNRLDHRGHGPIATWGDDEASRAEAATVFRSHQLPLAEGGRGCTMYDISACEAGALGKKLDSFDPEATEILVVPRLVAG
jgi:hypothetical protein